MTTKEYAEIKRLWVQGSSVRDIAHAVGHSAHAIRQLAYRNRHDFPARRSLTTNWERQRIRELRSQGMTYREVAREVGRSLCAVQNALKEEE